MREQRGLNANTFKRRASLPPEETAYFTTRSRYTAPKAATFVEEDEEEEVSTRPPTRTSARRYDLAPFAGRGERRTEALPRSGKHPLFYVGLSLLIMIIFLIAYTVILQVYQKWQDDRTYGYPRTYQTDANVGHGGMEHFITLNNHGTIEVLEIPANPNQTNQPRLYIIVRLSSQGADLVPATLSFPDVNADGKPDLQVTVLDGTNPSVWILFNNGTTFVPKL